MAQKSKFDHVRKVEGGCHSCNFLFLSSTSGDNAAAAAVPTPELAFQAQDSESHCDHLDDDPSNNSNLSGPRLGKKRKRAAQVHKLSEKRRRHKINKRLRALQDLIPNCTKMDIASVLDDAIEYLKSLQYQLRIMSTFAGLPTQMMLPTYYPGSAMAIAMRLGMAAQSNALQCFNSPFLGYGTRL